MRASHTPRTRRRSLGWSRRRFKLLGKCTRPYYIRRFGPPVQVFLDRTSTGGEAIIPEAAGHYCRFDGGVGAWGTSFEKRGSSLNERSWGSLRMKSKSVAPRAIAFSR